MKAGYQSDNRGQGGEEVERGVITPIRIMTPGDGWHAGSEGRQDGAPGVGGDRGQDDDVPRVGGPGVEEDTGAVEPAVLGRKDVKEEKYEEEL